MATLALETRVSSGSVRQWPTQLDPNSGAPLNSTQLTITNQGTHLSRPQRLEYGLPSSASMHAAVCPLGPAQIAALSYADWAGQRLQHLDLGNPDLPEPPLEHPCSEDVQQHILEVGQRYCVPGAGGFGMDMVGGSSSGVALDSNNLPECRRTPCHVPVPLSSRRMRPLCRPQTAQAALLAAGSGANAVRERVRNTIRREAKARMDAEMAMLDVQDLKLEKEVALATAANEASLREDMAQELEVHTGPGKEASAPFFEVCVT